jgi:hypothetical protein
MVKDVDWVTKRVNEAHKAHPSVADSAATRILELIKRKIMDRQLSAAELREIAKMLLADIAPLTSPKTGVTDAN